MNYRKLVGEKVYLSPVSTEDWREYSKWAEDYETSFLANGGGRVSPPATGPSSLENRAKNQNAFTIVDKETDLPIGNCGFNYEDVANRYAKIGITIGEKAYWSKGCGTDAVGLMLDFGFRVRGYNNINLNVYEYNERAIVCYEKLGFKRQGVWRDSLIQGEKRYDCIHMDMLAEEYFERMDG
jgi:RimJ/RimL family protein N-acetyltransferase